MTRLFSFTDVLLPEIIFLIVLLVLYFKVKNKENKWMILGNTFFLITLFYSLIVCINGFNLLAISPAEEKAHIVTDFLSTFLFLNFWGILINLLIRLCTQLKYLFNLKTEKN